MRTMTPLPILALTTSLCATNVQAQAAANIDATELLLGFSQLLNTPEGQAVLEKNLSTSIGINNGATDAEKAQAVYDNTIAALVGSFSNGQLVSDALGQKLSDAFNATNSLAPNYQATTFSDTFQALMSQVNALAQSDSSFAKNFYANGSDHGDPAHPAVGIELPSDGQFNVYDKAYSPDPANANTVGNSRPVQVRPDQIQNITAEDYFGNTVNTTTDVTPSLISNASFPSGHSAFGFVSTLLFAQMVPEKYQEFLARGAEYGNSRIVLGAHYALDVMGARIMATKAVADMLNNSDLYTNRSFTSIFGAPVTSTDDFSGLMASATTDLRSILETGCGGTISGCIATSEADRFSDNDQLAADYAHRLTYDLGSTGDTTLAAVVPEGAEVLLKTRFGYLTDEQRRDVLASTELASGGPLDDGSGWARLDLFTAANGYGAFEADVDVTMSAADGGFSASDEWSNDISGPGGLTKRGDGRLELSGANTYTGDTTVAGGTLAVTGSLTSDVTVEEGAKLVGTGILFGDTTVSGRLEPGDSPGHMDFGGDLTLTSTSVLALEFAGESLFDTLSVGGDFSIEGGALELSLLDGFSFDFGQMFQIVDVVGTLSGYFAGLAEGALISGFGADLFITYQAGDGNDIALYTEAPAPVPLPASVLLLGAGAGALAMLRRRKG